MFAELPKEENLSLVTELNDDRSVGLIGGYCEDGFPIYYATDQMAHMLGYWDVADLIEGIDGMVANTIHPDDAAQVTKDLNGGNYYEGMTYKTTYRMPKKDGSWMWTVDKGKVIRAEDGRLAIISMCSDMTDFLDRQAELERQNNISRVTLENMPGGYHRCSIEDGFPFIYISDRFLDIFGWTRQEIRTEFDNKFLNMLHPEDRQLINTYVGHIQETCGTNKISDAIYRMRGKNGYIWVSDATSLVKTEGSSFFQGTLTDITGFVAEKELHTEVIRSLSTIYTTIFRVELDTHYYEILTSVELMGEVAGTSGSFDAVKQEVLTAFIAPDMRGDMDKFLDLNTLVARLRDINTVAAEYKDPEGRWFQARFIVKNRDDSGAAKAVLYVARDITHEKWQELIQQERLSALSQDYTAVFACDLCRDTMEPMRVKDYSHFSRESAHTACFSEWVRYSCENIIVKESIPDYSEVFERHYLMKYLTEHHMLLSKHRVRPNGAGQQYFEVRVVPYYHDENSFQVVWAFRSIDDIIQKEKKQQEQLTLLLAAAEQSNKAKTTFLNSMSHDIRTPMNAIIGFTALAQTHIDNAEQVQDYLTKISTSGTHLLSLINDILDMSRIESGSVKLEEAPVHIPDVLHDLRTMIQGLINAKNQNLYIDTQDVQHEDIIADKLRLNQVLINIVGNAVKFTPVGGDIMVRLSEKPCALKQYTTYEFSIKDTGIGMSEEFVEHIFDAFSREYSATVSGIQGTGLGMAITKNIVDMMGGRIEVHSKQGRGSVFTVTIDVRLASEPVIYTPIPELLGARVLVVDDDIDTCRSVCKMLRSIEMRPDWTASGREAILRAQDAAELKDEYRVYIVDYLMPDMNGIEAVRRIRRTVGAEVPIIILTAYDWSAFEQEAREAGVTAFVAKPIFMSELRAVLTNPTAASETAAAPKAGKYDYSGRRVLVVEDNELNREIATAILEETGMEIDCAVDGIEAVEIINRVPADRYDLILMDIQMPRMDGYTATREIRTLRDNKKANIPIVAMTANAFEEDKKKAIETGMNAHLIKPISIDSIAAVLDTIFEK